MNNTEPVYFNEDEYRNMLKDFNIDTLKAELKVIDTELEEENAKIETNHNMIDRFIDTPGMEHLVEMSVLGTAEIPTRINILKAKRTILLDLLS